MDKEVKSVIFGKKQSNKDSLERKITKLYSTRDAAWKLLVSNYKREFITALFPKLVNHVNWDAGIKDLNNEFYNETEEQIVEKLINDTDSVEEVTEKIHNNKRLQELISDNLFEVELLDKTKKAIYLHLEYQSYKDSTITYGEKMFNYYCDIRNKYTRNSNAEILSAVIFTNNPVDEKELKYVATSEYDDSFRIEYHFTSIIAPQIDIGNFEETSILGKAIFIENSIRKSKNKLNTKIELWNLVYLLDDTDLVKNLITFIDALIKLNYVESQEFNKIVGGNNMSALEWLKDRLREEGKELGSEIHKEIYREEVRKIGREEGKKEAWVLAADLIMLIKANNTPEEMAQYLHMDVNEVIDCLIELGLYQE